MQKQISLSQNAVNIINEIVSSGKTAEVREKNGHLAIYAVPKSTKKYEVVVAPPR